MKIEDVGITLAPSAAHDNMRLVTLTVKLEGQPSPEMSFSGMYKHDDPESFGKALVGAAQLLNERLPIVVKKFVEAA